MKRAWQYLALAAGWLLAILASLAWWRASSAANASSERATDLADENASRAHEQGETRTRGADARASAEVEHGLRVNDLAGYLRTRRRS